MRLRILVAVALIAVALAPSAVADHAYSHRYIVFGRVIDADGFPVKGVQVSATLEGQQVEPGSTPGGCDPRHPPVTQATTGEDGSYFWCFHTHPIRSVAASYKVSVVGHGNETKTGPLDADLRKSNVNFQLPASLPGSRGSENLSTTYDLVVVLWKPGDTSIEQIQVEGTALTNRPVTATLTYNGNKTVTKEGRTTDYGDVFLSFDLAEPLQSGTARIVGPEDRAIEVPLDPVFHTSMATVEYPGDPWYTNSGLLGFAVITGAIVLGVGGWAVYRFRKKSAAPASRAARRRR